MKLYWLILASPLALLFGCQTQPKTEQLVYPKELLVDQRYFSGEIRPVETEQQIFELPAAVKAELHSQLNMKQDIYARTKTIVGYIFSFAHNGLLYDNSATKTVSETLSNGKANCLSLSILAYSLAKEAGLDAVFQDVQIPEYWTSELNTTWLNGHVNLRLRQQRIPEKHSGAILLGSDVVVDFDPAISRQRFVTKTLEQHRVPAMFYNNKAAEMQSKQQFAQAYQYYLAAIAADPHFAVSWSNLGVLYRQHGLDRLAEQVYLYSLKLKPNSLNTMANLAILYQLSGREQLATQLQKRVSQARKSNPFYYIMLGHEALRRNELRAAIAQYEQAVRLDKQNHEAYFSLAKTYYLLHDTVQAQRYLQHAKRTAVHQQDKVLYQKKLNTLLQLASVH